MKHKYLLGFSYFWPRWRTQLDDVKAKKLKNKPRVVRAGTGVRKSDSTRSQRKTKMKRLQQTGHVDDAATLLEDMFNS